MGSARGQYLQHADQAAQADRTQTIELDMHGLLRVIAIKLQGSGKQMQQISLQFRHGISLSRTIYQAIFN